MKPDELDSNFSAAKLVIIETKARDPFSLVHVDTGTTLRRDAKFLKHASSQHIGNDIDVDISAKTEESIQRKKMTLSKAPSSLVRFCRKPSRVIRLSPQCQEGHLNQRGIVIISFTIELTICIV